ncbi:MAG TPA: hypothetical protein VHY09_05465 [Candidatus Methylacidiphilales bacterium]|jgi:uncharacterized membrane protein YgcG|nr:hypothetical protein [Candidatus Methylacidiphilales bacterium]
MESGGFNGIAVFIVLAVITGVIGYLAMLQAKVKRQIEESRRQRERDDLAAMGGTVPSAPSAPPDVAPGKIADITPHTLPKITPGGTPPSHHPHQPHDAGTSHPQDTGGHHGGFDGGGHHGGGFDGGGGGGGGHH